MSAPTITIAHATLAETNPGNHIDGLAAWTIEDDPYTGNKAIPLDVLAVVTDPAYDVYLAGSDQGYSKIDGTIDPDILADSIAVFAVPTGAKAVQDWSIEETANNVMYWACGEAQVAVLTDADLDYRDYIYDPDQEALIRADLLARWQANH